MTPTPDICRRCVTGPGCRDSAQSTGRPRAPYPCAQCQHWQPRGRAPTGRRGKTRGRERRTRPGREPEARAIASPTRRGIQFNRARDTGIVARGSNSTMRARRITRRISALATRGDLPLPPKRQARAHRSLLGNRDGVRKAGHRDQQETLNFRAVAEAGPRAPGSDRNAARHFLFPGSERAAESGRILPGSAGRLRK